MTAFDTTGARFLRPPDLAKLRRNQRRIRAGRLLVLLRNALLVTVVVGGSVWAWRHTQSDQRFGVRSIEFAGAVHTPAAALDEIGKRYAGSNLFQIDLARLQRDLEALPWVERIAVEKKLPDALRINIVERRPVALARTAGQIFYVDRKGLAFTELTPAAGDDDLPVIVGAEGSELARTVVMLESLRQTDPSIYTRISEVRPVAPRGFAFYDRDLDAFVFANAEDLAAKWRSLYAVARSEGLGRGGIEYADLRFANRVVLKPVEQLIANGGVQPPPAPEVTN
ncbi:MAG: FtsQ-type POTRA domain-containing protein [Thermoanaerobaculia bacterium]